ncbi:MAG: ABC transporter permease [Bryobacteraceae bacterium]|nr:ABC transporter permease [Bryobacteraceae bacterium]
MLKLRTLFLAPGALLLLTLLAAPMAIVFIYSFSVRGVYGGVTADGTLENYARLFDGLYAAIFVRTFLMAGLATACCLILGFPVALFISRADKRKNLWLTLVMLPFWTSFLVRIYGWMFLLRDTGLVNTVLQELGIISAPLPLLYNDGAVFTGLIYGYLPFAVLPLYATLGRLDKSLIEAAADLGATRLDTMLRIIIPLCAPGFRAAGLLVFIPCLGAYLTPDLLGGGKSVMAGNLIQTQFTTARDWPFGSAVALALMAISMSLVLFPGRVHSIPRNDEGRL